MKREWMSHPADIAQRAVSLAERVTKLVEKTEQEHTFGFKDLVKYIKWAARHHETVDIVVDGAKGAGKTTFALLLAKAVYGTWDEALKHLYFKPTELLLDIYKHVMASDVIPVAILDDAGAWLSKWTINSEKEAFYEAMELSRTVVGATVFTGVASIAKYLRATAELRVRIRRLEWNERQKLARATDKPSVKRSLLNKRVVWSEARIYKTWFTLQYNIRFKRQAVLIFPARLPNRIYKQYIEKRREYTAIKMLLSLLRIARKYPQMLPDIMERAEAAGIAADITKLICDDQVLRRHAQTYSIACRS